MNYLYSSWNSPGQNTRVGSLSLLQGIFPIQESNPDLLHCRQILYQLSHKGTPRILEWVTYPFSSRSSRPRNWTEVSCITDGFFTNWALRQAPRRHTCWQSKKLYCEGDAWAQSSGVREPRRTALPHGSQSHDDGISFQVVSGQSLWLRVVRTHCSAKMGASEKDSGRW